MVAEPTTRNEAQLAKVRMRVEVAIAELAQLLVDWPADPADGDGVSRTSLAIDGVGHDLRGAGNLLPLAGFGTAE